MTLNEFAGLWCIPTLIIGVIIMMVTGAKVAVAMPIAGIIGFFVVIGWLSREKK